MLRKVERLSKVLSKTLFFTLLIPAATKDLGILLEGWQERPTLEELKEDMKLCVIKKCWKNIQQNEINFFILDSR